MTEFPYHRACGPLALAALAGRSPYVVADDLLRIQRARGRVTAPGTKVEDMHTWLLRRGFVVAPWNLEADAPEDADEYREFILATPPDPEPDPRTLPQRIAAACPDFPPEQVEAVLADALSCFATVREWLLEHPAGAFLLQVDGHYLAARQGRIVAGDAPGLLIYGEVPLLFADRVSR